MLLLNSSDWQEAIAARWRGRRQAGGRWNWALLFCVCAGLGRRTPPPAFGTPGLLPALSAARHTCCDVQAADQRPNLPACHRHHTATIRVCCSGPRPTGGPPPVAGLASTGTPGRRAPAAAEPPMHAAPFVWPRRKAGPSCARCWSARTGEHASSAAAAAAASWPTAASLCHAWRWTRFGLLHRTRTHPPHPPSPPRCRTKLDISSDRRFYGARAHALATATRCSPHGACRPIARPAANAWPPAPGRQRSSAPPCTTNPPCRAAPAGQARGHQLPGAADRAVQAEDTARWARAGSARAAPARSPATDGHMIVSKAAAAGARRHCVRRQRRAGRLQRGRRPPTRASPALCPQAAPCSTS
jgi:hypothetical protein